MTLYDPRVDRDRTKTPHTPEIIAHFFDSLEMPAKTLTAWELQFLESAKDQFDRRGTITEKQFEILERIYTEKAP